FREDDANQAMDTLLRMKGKFPILIGDPGVGKSAVEQLFIENIVVCRYPQNAPYKQRFDGAVVLQVSARRFLPGGMDIGTYLSTVRVMQNAMKRPIIVVVNEAQFLQDYQISALREESEKSDPQPIWIETDSKSYGNSIKGHPSFTSIAQPIMVRELARDKVEEILETEVSGIEKTYDVQISNDVLKALVDAAPDFRPDIA